MSVPEPQKVAPPRGLIGRLSYRVLAVEPEEWKPMVLAWIYFFCLLASYYMLRPIRETMGIARGWDNLTWLMTGTLVVMALTNPAFAWLASRMPRRKFIPLVNRFFAVNLVIFFGLLLATDEKHKAWVGYAFYIWLSVFNLFVISVFWAFLGDIFRTSDARRLFGVVGIGGTLGAITGATLARQLIEWLHEPRMLLCAAATLEVATWAMIGLARTNRSKLEEQRAGGEEVREASIPSGPPPEACPSCAYDLRSVPEDAGRKRCPECGLVSPPGVERTGPLSREPGPGIWRGLTITLRSPYLLLVCSYLLLYTMTSTFLYMEQGRIVEAHFADSAARTKMFANLDIWTNVVTLIIQTFLTGRLVRWLGVGMTLALLPLLTAAGFGLFWTTPTLLVIAAIQVSRRGLNYAVSRPVRETLFAPLSPDEKYKSKTFIDTFVYRGGDQIGAWVPKWIAALSIPLGFIAVPASLLWVVVAVVIGTIEQRRRNAERAALELGSTPPASSAPAPAVS
ncbi:MAG: MFS transporter [Phycisphaerales bacterium]|nr:MFS transporter [Phycisphaerales bacterium]